jgi:hypothetical protein
MAQFRTSHTFDVLFILLIVGLVCLAGVHRQAIGDWAFFTTHHPSLRATEVADATHLAPLGRQLLYRGDTQFASAAEITKVCDHDTLGCLTASGVIFVYDDQTNPNQTLVTTVHELLHLAYRRLNPTERAQLTDPLAAAVDQFGPQGLNLELSEIPDSAEQLDEAQARLGTEYSPLPASLEQYFSQYLSNRNLIVKAAESSRP